MTDIMAHTEIGRREDFPEKLVDLFFRASKNSDLNQYITMKDLTTFLIDHEITQPKNAMQNDMRYEESKIKDPSTHNNHIERIYYFERIDMVLLYEESMKQVRVYRGDDMTFVMDIVCDSNILALEYCVEKNAIAISLADRTICFFDGNKIKKEKDGEAGKGTKVITKLHVPCT